MNLRFWGSMSVALLLGCGPSAAGDTGSGSGSGSDGTDSASDSNSSSSAGPTGTTAGTTSDSGTTGTPTDTTTTVGTTTDPTAGSTTGEDACDPFLDETATATPVEVRIENGTDAVLFLPFYCDVEFLTVTDAAGATWPPPFCTQTCEENECIDCGGCPSGLVRVEPGGSWTLSWPGELFAILDVLDTCPGFGACNEPTCPARRVPGSGEVQLEVSYASEAECLTAASQQNQPPESCECMVSQEGSCNTYAGFDIPGSMSAQASLTVGETQVTIALE